MAPLVLSVRRPTGSGSIRQDSAAREGSCRFCAAPAKPQEPSSFLDADGACPFCILVRRLDRPGIDEETVLIWLPELTQAALIAIVHECHRRLAKHGLQHLAGVGRSAAGEEFIPVEAREALVAIASLRGRIEEVEARLGSSSPKALAQALVRVDAKTYADRARRLHGVRLMPLGRNVKAAPQTLS
ncbi:hypothetical protein [uncultured Rhodoblastus sp.]|uniref:hypothetical protein n=1 Tax=uncultured Rhodoblastus sp. TaxID=543037 RepID=UPI0025D21F17|nr:hypothetical protein [uncultured Rhodoblastus sp.]